jgi:hypothetical protein
MNDAKLVKDNEVREDNKLPIFKYKELPLSSLTSFSMVNFTSFMLSL